MPTYTLKLPSASPASEEASSAAKKKPPRFEWTAEKEALLRRYWREQVPVSEIATWLGVSYMVVFNKLKTLGLKSSAKAWGRQRSSKPAQHILSQDSTVLDNASIEKLMGANDLPVKKTGVNRQEIDLVAASEVNLVARAELILGSRVVTRHGAKFLDGDHRNYLTRVMVEANKLLTARGLAQLGRNPAWLAPTKIGESR